MQTYRLGTSDLNVTRIGYGCMLIGGSWDDTPLTDSIRKAAMRSVHTALDAGINFFDHADIYCNGKSEEVFGDLWKDSPNLRQQIYLQTKCGIRFAPPLHRFDFSYEHIVNSVEGSLQARFAGLGSAITRAPKWTFCESFSINRLLSIK